MRSRLAGFAWLACVILERDGEALSMERLLDVSAPITLAKCRRDGTVVRLPLHKLASRAEAEAFQVAAVRALGREPCGYKIGATSIEAQQLLSCQEPIHAPILREDLLASGATFPIPAGLLGVECEFGFLLGRDFPTSAEMLDITALRSAIAECFVALELVGRRVAPDLPLNEVSSIADFALDVAVVRGAPIRDWGRQDLALMPVRAVLDGVTVASGTGAMVLGHPLNALLWLAEALRKRGDKLRSGEMILTGTCTGITKVAPGQVFAGCFADLPPVRVQLA
jgi:2-keto-4-pentenoate hydratase